MTIEVTEEDREAANEFLRGPILGVDGVRRLENILARHRQVAYEKGQRDAVERLMGLGGGS